MYQGSYHDLSEADSRFKVFSYVDPDGIIVEVDTYEMLRKRDDFDKIMETFNECDCYEQAKFAALLCTVDPGEGKGRTYGETVEYVIHDFLQGDLDDHWDIGDCVFWDDDLASLAYAIDEGDDMFFWDVHLPEMKDCDPEWFKNAMNELRQEPIDLYSGYNNHAQGRLVSECFDIRTFGMNFAYIEDSMAFRKGCGL